MSSQTVAGRVVVDSGEAAPGTLTIEVEEVDVTSMRPTYGPDPEWTYTDLAGHFHAWSSETLPTLERVEVVIGRDDEGDPITERTYRCRACAEDIEPGRITVRRAFERETMPGRSSWSVTVSIPHGRAIGYATRHSVRVMHLAGEHFGFARGTALTDSGVAYSMTLIGDGPLGSR